MGYIHIDFYAVNTHSQRRTFVVTDATTKRGSTAGGNHGTVALVVVTDGSRLFRPACLFVANGRAGDGPACNHPTVIILLIVIIIVIITGVIGDIGSRITVSVQVIIIVIVVIIV